MDKGIIVSCQAEEGSYLNNIQSIVALAKEAERGGAVAVRIEGVDNISAVKKEVDIPVIGLIKKKYTTGKVWITPSILEAKLIEAAGADYIAADATGRKDALTVKDGWKNLRDICELTSVPVIGDMAYPGLMNKHIHMAEKCGCKMLSTTLSGYTEYCEPTEEPDFDFLKLLSEKSILPIIAEGRYSTKEHVYFAKQNGASNIVIGTAITRPHLITKRFKENFDEI
tara:strand:+ start:1692 stop:2369 length:678 start_codon:yes stop_codon:yes gene_type:complete